MVRFGRRGWWRQTRCHGPQGPSRTTRPRPASPRAAIAVWKASSTCPVAYDMGHSLSCPTCQPSVSNDHPVDTASGHSARTGSWARCPSGQAATHIIPYLVAIRNRGCRGQDQLLWFIMSASYPEPLSISAVQQGWRHAVPSRSPDGT